MSGQITSPGVLSFGLVAFVVGASMLLGAVDVIRQPGWAWQRAEESKPSYLILVLLVPIIGLGIYARKARPKVVAMVSTGSGVTLPTEPVDDQVEHVEHQALPPEETPTTFGFDTVEKVNALSGHPSAPEPVGHPSIAETTGHPSVAQTTPSDFDAQTMPSDFDAQTTPSDLDGPVEVSSTFFSNGKTVTRTAHPHLSLVRSYRPKQRTSLHDTDDETPTVPPGWNADPTERHQYRYWDGFHWTENVADAGHQTRDSVGS